MAEMGLGYGSEFQLLRFLGHHRDELNELIHESTGMSGAIHWKDFGYDDNKMCGDRELKGIECFKTLENYFQINEENHNMNESGKLACILILLEHPRRHLCRQLTLMCHITPVHNHRAEVNLVTSEQFCQHQATLRCTISTVYFAIKVLTDIQ